VNERWLAGCALVVSLGSLGGCRENRKSETMTAHDVTSPPASPRPPGAAPVTRKLAEAIDKAATHAGSSPHFRFKRGHEISGITTFDVRDDGSYELSRTPRKGGPPLAFTGRLDAAQRQALFGALSRAAILSVASSTRPLGDDEQPIAVELDGAGEHFALSIWAGDARDSPQFSELAAQLYPLLDHLSGGALLLQP